MIPPAMGPYRPAVWAGNTLYVSGSVAIRLEPGTTKNKESRTLPIYGEMREWLSMQREIRDAQYPTSQSVFYNDGKPIRNFRKSWDAACTEAGLDGLIFHDLRRTAVRNMVRAGIPEKIAMQISGHKTRSVFDRYNIVSDRDLDLVSERMERHFAMVTGTITGTVADSTEKLEEEKIRKLLN